MASYQFICPSTYVHEGVQVLRNSLRDPIVLENVWIFKSEFLAEQAMIYRGMAERNMDDTATAVVVAERVRMMRQINGVSWYKAHAPHAAVEASERACGAAADVDAAAMADDAVWKTAADEYDRLATETVQLFENLVYIECANKK